MTPSVGLFGKLPSRGDFVRLGLPRDFTDPWDEAWQRGLAAASEHDWTGAWLEAPVWQFALPPGICGALAIFGVVMPSVDSVGRYYPLTLAATSPPGWDDAFLEAAETAGRDAVAHDVPPDATLARLPLPTRTTPALPPTCIFRTEGGPRVAPREDHRSGLPTPEAMAGMIDDSWASR